jgi:cation diffusion facilitator family transporter
VNDAQNEFQRDAQARLRAGLVSLILGALLLAAKYLAYLLTGSTAILSDALESIVNVVAALFSLGAIVFAGQPADRNHPYGHGKIEFFSAVFEGGLIAFAAVLILYTASITLVHGVELKSLDRGIAITVGAGVANALLGVYLIRTGKRHHSLALVADGQHVLTDFWTTVGVVAGLGLVWVTGWPWFDPLVAVVVGVNLAWTGFRLVRRAAGGLLDEEDTELLGRLVNAINEKVEPGIIRIHFLRAIRAGRFTHVDAHLVVPEFWTVSEAHDHADRFEARVIKTLPSAGEMVFHTDPCRRLYCAVCDVQNCPVRAQPFEKYQPMTLEEALQSDDALYAWLRSKEDRWGAETEDSGLRSKG